MSKYKNVIFDLGGVLLNIDYNKTSDAFKQLGFEHFDEMYSQYAADPIFAGLETGLFNESSFYDHVKSGGKPGVTQQKIIHAWNAMLLNFRLTSLKFLEELGHTHQLYLLSNTNKIHHEAFTQMFLKETNYTSFENFFTKAYYSHEVGLRKPGKDIFTHVLNDAAINAEHTLFIDDSYNNIETAETMGFHTHLLKSEEVIENLAY